MNLTLSQEESQIKNAAKRLAAGNFSDDAFTWFGHPPKEHAEILSNHGYLGMSLPEEYGGSDATLFETLLAMEGIGEVCPDTAVFLMNTNFGNAQIISEFAAEKYRDKYLPRLVEPRKHRVEATAMSEPQAGSDVTAIQTEAELDGDNYVVNGQKIWVTGAHTADVFITYVRYPDGNIGTLLIDADTEGVVVQEPDYNMYGHGQCQIFLDDVRVRKDRELVTGPDSFKAAMQYYNLNRVLDMAHNWTIAKWLFDEALEYAQKRETFGHPISSYQGVSHRLADMAVKLETTRWLIYRAASSDEPPDRLLASMVKIQGSEKLHEVADAALQIKGANGYVGDTQESWAYRKLRGSQIAGGTPNIHRNNLFKSLVQDGYPDIDYRD